MGSRSSIRLHVQPELAIQGARIVRFVRCELVPRRGHLPIPLGIAIESGIALLGMGSEVLVAIAVQWYVGSALTLALLVAP